MASLARIARWLSKASAHDEVQASLGELHWAMGEMADLLHNRPYVAKVEPAMPLSPPISEQTHSDLKAGQARMPSVDQAEPSIWMPCAQTAEGVHAEQAWAAQSGNFFDFDALDEIEAEKGSCAREAELTASSAESKKASEEALEEAWREAGEEAWRELAASSTSVALNPIGNTNGGSRPKAPPTRERASRMLEKLTRAFVRKKAHYVNLCSRDKTPLAEFSRMTATKQATPMLYMSVRLGDVAYVRYYCREGGTLDMRNAIGCTPLHVACWYGHLEIVGILCERCSDPNALDGHGITPLSHIMSPLAHNRPAAIAVIRCLLEFGSDVNRGGTIHGTPVHLSAYFGRLDVLEALCESGADIEKPTRDGATPLHSACFKGHAHIVQYLLHLGADTEKTLRDGRTPLSIAAHWGHTDVVNCLCESDADIDKALHGETSLLDVASSHERHEIVRWLTSMNNRLFQKILRVILGDHDANHDVSTISAELRQAGISFDRCHSQRFSADVVTTSPKDYGTRGDRTYYRPFGWLRLSIRRHDFSALRDWCVAYHGTARHKLASILTKGILRPGEGDVWQAHGHSGSGYGQSVYLTPSIEYAGHPVYAPFFEVGDGHWAQVVLQCRVRPGGIREQPATLWEKHWPPHVRMDPNFPSTANLEWLVDDPADVIVCGVMVREFGAAADPTTFGATACQVTASSGEAFSWPGGSGPQYAWTRSRSMELERQGFLIQRARR